MKILLIGSGAREHAIFQAIEKSPISHQTIVFAKTKNPGMLTAHKYFLGDIESLPETKKIALEIQPDIAIIGPDNPIGLGVTDLLQSLNIKTFAPTKSLARLESSKAFTRNLLTKYKIEANPIFQTFTADSTDQQILDFIEKQLNGQYVVKYDGLFGGKGVKVSGEHLLTSDEGLQFARECLKNASQVVIEEKFIGVEFSLICLTDGKTLLPTPVIQDYKRALQGDIGSNTGGMGTISDANHLLPFISQQDQQAALEITAQVLAALQAETSETFIGVLYGGFIKTKNGIKLIEYNTRFGDPEALNIFSLLESDFLEVVLSSFQQTLHQTPLKFKELASVCLYVVPPNYPDNDFQLTESEQLLKVKKLSHDDPNSFLYFAAVDLLQENNQEWTLQMTSSRVLAFVALAPTISQAHTKALSLIESVSGKIAFRADIGSEFLIQSKIDLINSFSND